MASRFEVPNVGNADTVAYYVETKYKFTPELFGAVRWNQQLYDDVPNGAGGKEPWDHDMWRIDSAVGYRFTRHIQAKLQYSYSHQTGHIQQGEQMAAVQLTVKF
jgi:predicted porin